MAEEPGTERFCTNCDSELLPEARFCPSCGTRTGGLGGGVLSVASDPSNSTPDSDQIQGDDEVITYTRRRKSERAKGSQVVNELVETGWSRADVLPIVAAVYRERQPDPRTMRKIDCPNCGANSVYATWKGEFACGWFLFVFGVLYLIYHFVFKRRGGDCSACGRRLPKELR